LYNSHIILVVGCWLKVVGILDCWYFGLID